MILMARKKPSKPKRVGIPINVWVDDRLREALDSYVAGAFPRTTLTRAVEEALLLLFQKHGVELPKSS